MTGSRRALDLSKLQRLRQLAIHDRAGLAGWETLKVLEWLELGRSRRGSFAFLGEAPHLELINIVGLGQELDLSSVGRLTALRGLDLSKVVVTDLSRVALAGELRGLSLTRVKSTHGALVLDPLLEVGHLERLHLEQVDVSSTESIEMLRAAGVKITMSRGVTISGRAVS